MCCRTLVQSINQRCGLVVASSIHTCWEELQEKVLWCHLDVVLVPCPYPLVPPASCSLELPYLSGLHPRRRLSLLHFLLADFEAILACLASFGVHFCLRCTAAFLCFYIYRFETQLLVINNEWWLCRRHCAEQLTVAYAAQLF